MASKTDIRSRMDLELRDVSNLAFTADEKNEAYQRAIDDEAVYVVIEDEDQTFSSGTRGIELDDSYKAVLSVQVDWANDGFPTPIKGDWWSYNENAKTLNFSRRAMNIPDGTPLFITVAQKLTATDDVPDYLVAYVMNLAISYCAEFLSNVKVNRFLKNDTTMGDLINRINIGATKAQMLKRTLRNQQGTTI